MGGKKTIFIAHNWSYDSFACLSYYLALELSTEHTVVFLNAKGARKKYEKINENLEVYDWPHKRPTRLKDFIFLIHLIKRYKPNAIIAHFSAVNISILCSKLLGVKNRYCYYHTLTQQIDIDKAGGAIVSFNNRADRWRKKMIYNLSSCIISGTDFARNDIIENYKISGHRIKTIYNGIPDTSYRNSFTSNSIGFLGRLDFSKGVDILIAAVGKLIDRNIEITVEIAGTGKEQKRLEEVINTNGWQKRIKFVGFIPYSQVHGFISKHYMMVVPSRIDNPSVVLLEAFCTQTPVIGAAAGAIPEIIDHCKTGLLFKTEDSDDLAEKILALMNDRKLRDDIALAGRKKFEERFTINKNVEEVKKLVLQGF